MHDCGCFLLVFIAVHAALSAKLPLKRAFNINESFTWSNKIYWLIEVLTQQQQQQLQWVWCRSILSLLVIPPPQRSMSNVEWNKRERKKNKQTSSSKLKLVAARSLLRGFDWSEEKQGEERNRGDWDDAYRPGADSAVAMGTAWLGFWRGARGGWCWWDATGPRVQETRRHGGKDDGAVGAWKDLHNFHPASVLTADWHLGNKLAKKPNIPLVWGGGGK